MEALTLKGLMKSILVITRHDAVIIIRIPASGFLLVFYINIALNAPFVRYGHGTDRETAFLEAPYHRAGHNK